MLIENIGCTYAHTGIGVCVNDGYVECPYYYVDSSVDCRDASNYNATMYNGTNFYFGYDSMCVKGRLPTNSKAFDVGHSCF